MMAEQHVRAVQRNKQLYADDTEWMIAQVIATDMGRNNEPAWTSLRELAQRAGCHYNTVSRRIKDMVKNELVTAEKQDNGRFYHSVTIDCDVLEDLSPQKGQAKQADVTTPSTSVVTSSQHVTIDGDMLMQAITTLSQNIANLSQLVGQLVTTPSTAIVTEVREVEEGKNKTPPKPPSLGDGWGKTGQVMFFYCEETGRKIPDVNDKKKLERWMVGANEMLGQCGDDVTKTCELVMATIAYMEQAGLNHSSPASLVNVAKQVQRDTSAQAIANDAGKAWNNVVSQLSGKGWQRFKDWEITEAEKSAFVTVSRQNGGVRDVCAVPSGVLNSHIKGAFIQAYNGANNE